MSKTFDNISEAASTNYLFLKAQMTISLEHEPPTPPPFYALSFPSELLCAALWLVKRKRVARFRSANAWALRAPENLCLARRIGSTRSTPLSRNP